MSTLYLGYDPGGNGNHGVAAIEGGKVSCDTMRTAKKAIEWFHNYCNDHEPAALGIDTLTMWSTGPSGWRPADRALRAAYPDVANSVAASNSLYGSMPINGVAVARELLRAFPKLRITETHPKVLYFALTGLVYDFVQHREIMTQQLLDLVAVKSCEVRTDHEWDALLSAYAAQQWVTDQWQTDLHLLTASADEALIPAHGTEAYYAWPTIVPQTPEHARALHEPRQGRNTNTQRRYVSWKSAVEILKKAGYDDVAQQIAEFKNVRGERSGWDSWLGAKHPECKTLIESADE